MPGNPQHGMAPHTRSETLQPSDTACAIPYQALTALQRQHAFMKPRPSAIAHPGTYAATITFIVLGVECTAARQTSLSQHGLQTGGNAQLLHCRHELSDADGVA